MHVAIVGAGITGLATAWELTRRGHRITLLEQATAIPNPLAASGDQHRIIRRGYGAADDFRAGYDRMRIPHERLSPAEAAARFAFLDPDAFGYATLTPQGGALLC